MVMLIIDKNLNRCVQTIRGESRMKKWIVLLFLTIFIGNIMSFGANSYTPEVSFPRNNESFEVQDIEIDWDYISGKDYYLVSVRDMINDNPNGDPIINRERRTGSNYTIDKSMLEPNGYYKIKIASVFDGVEYWSDDVFFYTKDESYERPVIKEPDDSQILSLSDVYIDWPLISECDHYLVSVRDLNNDDPNGSPMINRLKRTSSSYTIDESKLEPNGHYKIKIAAVYGSHEAWSEDVFFFVEDQLEKPIIQVPDNHSVMEFSNVYVNWPSISAADNYVISVRDLNNDDPNGSPMINRVSRTRSNYTIDKSYLEEGGSYKIKVGAIYGKYEAWSQDLFFQVESNAPEAFDLNVSNTICDQGDKLSFTLQTNSATEKIGMSLKDGTVFEVFEGNSLISVNEYNGIKTWTFEKILFSPGEKVVQVWAGTDEAEKGNMHAWLDYEEVAISVNDKYLPQIAQVEIIEPIVEEYQSSEIDLKVDWMQPVNTNPDYYNVYLYDNNGIVRVFDRIERSEVLIDNSVLESGKKYWIEVYSIKEGWSYSTNSFAFYTMEEENPIAYRLEVDNAVVDKGDTATFTLITNKAVEKIGLSVNDDRIIHIFEDAIASENNGKLSWTFNKIMSGVGNKNVKIWAGDLDSELNQDGWSSYQSIEMTVNDRVLPKLKQVEIIEHSMNTNHPLYEPLNLTWKYEGSETIDAYKVFMYNELTQYASPEIHEESFAIPGQYFTKEGNYWISIYALKDGYEESMTSLSLNGKDNSSEEPKVMSIEVDKNDVFKGDQVQFTIVSNRQTNKLGFAVNSDRIIKTYENEFTLDSKGNKIWRIDKTIYEAGFKSIKFVAGDLDGWYGDSRVEFNVNPKDLPQLGDFQITSIDNGQDHVSGGDLLLEWSRPNVSGDIEYIVHVYNSDSGQKDYYGITDTKLELGANLFRNIGRTEIEVYAEKSGWSQSVTGVYFNVIAPQTNEIVEMEDTKTDKGSYAIYVLDSDSNKPLVGANVFVNGMVATTNSEGIAVFNDLKNETFANVDIELTQYQSVSISDTILLDSVKTIRMERDIVLGPYIKGVYGKKTDLDGNTENVQNLIGQTPVVLGFSKASNAVEKVEISVSANLRGLSPSKYILCYESDQEIKSNLTGIFQLSANDLLEGKKVYTYVVDQEGNKSDRKQLNIVKKEVAGMSFFNSEDPKLEFVIGKDVTIVIPPAIPLLGNQKFEIPLNDEMPVQVSLDDSGKYRFAIGVDETLNEDGWKQLEKIRNSTMLGKKQGLFSSYELSRHLDFSMIEHDYKVMGYGEGVVKDGVLKAELGVFINYRYGRTATRQFLIGVVPAYVKLGFEGALDANGHLNATCGQNGFEVNDPSLVLKPSLKVKPAAGVGIGGAVEGGIRGSVGIEADIRTSDAYYSGTITGNLEANIKVLMYERVMNIWKGSWPIYSSVGKSADLLSTASSSDVLDKNELRPMDLSKYKSHGHELLDIGVKSTDLLAYDEGNYGVTDLAVVKNNVRDLTEVKIIKSRGVNFIFWQSVDVINRTDQNSSKLVYSISTDFVNWSNPEAVDDDGTSDFQFDVIEKNGEICVVWQNNKSIIDGNIDINNMAGMSEIKLAIISADTLKVEQCMTLTDNSYIDFDPKLTVSDQDEFYVTWMSNSENDVFNVDGETALHFSKLNDVCELLVDDVIVYTTDKPLIEQDPGCVDGELVIAFEIDQDLNLASTEDRSIQIIDESSQIIDLSPAGNAQFSPRFFNMHGEERLFWVSDENIMVTSDFVNVDRVFSDDNTFNIDNFNLIGNDLEYAIVWSSASDDDGEEIFISKLIGNYGSEPVKVVDSSKYTSKVYGSITSDGYILSYGDYVGEFTNIHVSKVLPSLNTEITELIYDYAQINPGENIDIALTVHNNGLKDVDNLNIEFGGEVQKSVNGLNIKSGESYVMECSLTVPNSVYKMNELRFAAYASEEDVDEENRIDFELNKTDLSVEASPSYSDDILYANIKISNNA